MLNKFRDEWIQFNTEQGRYVYPELVNAYHADLLAEIARRVEELKKQELDFNKGDCTATRMYHSTCDDILQMIGGKE